VRALRRRLGVLGAKRAGARRAGHHHQAFERGGHLVAGQAKVAVLALHEQLDQPLVLQPRQVRARGGRGHLGHGGEFGGGARVAVHEAAQHAGARGLGDGAGQAGQLESAAEAVVSMRAS
jgi:hypothetical protein